MSTKIASPTISESDGQFFVGLNIHLSIIEVPAAVTTSVIITNSQEIMGSTIRFVGLKNHVMSIVESTTDIIMIM